jgi:hypothetical protein
MMKMKDITEELIKESGMISAWMMRGYIRALMNGESVTFTINDVVFTMESAKK